MADVLTMRAVTAPAMKLKELDDSSLVASFLAGEKRAFTELVSRYHVRLLNFIYRTIGDRDRAEDLVQETFIRVYRHLHRFDQTKKFSTWLYTIAGNLAKNELRNRSRNPLVLSLSDDGVRFCKHYILADEDYVQKAPGRYNPRRFPGRAIQRRNTVLDIRNIVFRLMSNVRSHPASDTRCSGPSPYFRPLPPATLNNASIDPNSEMHRATAFSASAGIDKPR